MSAATYSREQVRADAVAAGHSPAVAAYIASQIGLDTRKVVTGQQRSKPPAAPVPLSRSLTGKPQPPASLATAAAGASLRSVAAMYGPGAVALVPRFAAAGVSTKRVGQMLAEATGSARQLGESGVARLRYELDQIGTK